MNTTNFRKMYTPEEIKAIAGGGGGGKLYQHAIEFSSSAGAIIKYNSPEDPLIDALLVYIYNDRAEPFTIEELKDWLKSKNLSRIYMPSENLGRYTSAENLTYIVLDQSVYYLLSYEDIKVEMCLFNVNTKKKILWTYPYKISYKFNSDTVTPL